MTWDHLASLISMTDYISSNWQTFVNSLSYSCKWDCPSHIVLGFGVFFQSFSSFFKHTKHLHHTPWCLEVCPHRGQHFSRSGTWHITEQFVSISESNCRFPLHAILISQAFRAGLTSLLLHKCIQIDTQVLVPWWNCTLQIPRENKESEHNHSHWSLKPSPNTHQGKYWSLTEVLWGGMQSLRIPPLRKKQLVSSKPGREEGNCWKQALHYQGSSLVLPAEPPVTGVSQLSCFT